MQIYKITNTVTGKIYIGKDEKSRANYFGSGKLIRRSIDKYGMENHKKEVLEEVLDRQTLQEREKYWINELKTYDKSVGYNISYGGDGGDTLTNNPNRDNIIKKISTALKNRTFTEEHKQKLRDNHNSKQEQTRKNISKRLKGKVKSEDHKNKISETVRKHNLNTGKWQGYDNPMTKYKYNWFYDPATLKTSRHRADLPPPSNLLPGRPKDWQNQHTKK